MSDKLSQCYNCATLQCEVRKDCPDKVKKRKKRHNIKT